MIVFLDLETTGLHERRCGICQIGAVTMAPEIEFQASCRPHLTAQIEPRALEVNGETSESLRDPKRLPEHLAVIEFLGWLRRRQESSGKRVQFAGWNIHFDFRFLCAALEAASVPEEYWPFAHRLLDVHSIVAAARIAGKLGCDRLRYPHEQSGCIKNSGEACRLLSIAEEPMPHRAINGAHKAKELYCKAIALLDL